MRGIPGHKVAGETGGGQAYRKKGLDDERQVLATELRNVESINLFHFKGIKAPWFQTNRSRCRAAQNGEKS